MESNNLIKRNTFFKRRNNYVGLLLSCKENLSLVKKVTTKILWKVQI